MNTESNLKSNLESNTENNQDAPQTQKAHKLSTIDFKPNNPIKMIISPLMIILLNANRINHLFPIFYILDACAIGMIIFGIYRFIVPKPTMKGYVATSKLYIQQPSSKKHNGYDNNNVESVNVNAKKNLTTITLNLTNGEKLLLRDIRNFNSFSSDFHKLFK